MFASREEIVEPFCKENPNYRFQENKENVWKQF